MKHSVSLGNILIITLLNHGCQMFGCHFPLTKGERRGGCRGVDLNRRQPPLPLLGKEGMTEIHPQLTLIALPKTKNCATI